MVSSVGRSARCRGFFYEDNGTSKTSFAPKQAPLTRMAQQLLGPRRVASKSRADDQHGDGCESQLHQSVNFVRGARGC